LVLADAGNSSSSDRNSYTARQNETKQSKYYTKWNMQIKASMPTEAQK